MGRGGVARDGWTARRQRRHGGRAGPVAQRGGSGPGPPRNGHQPPLRRRHLPQQHLDRRRLGTAPAPGWGRLPTPAAGLGAADQDAPPSAGASAAAARGPFPPRCWRLTSPRSARCSPSPAPPLAPLARPGGQQGSGASPPYRPSRCCRAPPTAHSSCSRFRSSPTRLCSPLCPLCPPASRTSRTPPSHPIRHLRWPSARPPRRRPRSPPRRQRHPRNPYRRDRPRDGWPSRPWLLPPSPVPPVPAPSGPPPRTPPLPRRPRPGPSHPSRPPGDPGPGAGGGPCSPGHFPRDPGAPTCLRPRGAAVQVDSARRQGHGPRRDGPAGAPGPQSHHLPWPHRAPRSAARAGARRPGVTLEPAAALEDRRSEIGARMEARGGGAAEVRATRPLGPATSRSPFARKSARAARRAPSRTGGRTPGPGPPPRPPPLP